VSACVATWKVSEWMMCARLGAGRRCR